jgi:hypothetical protein
MGPAVGAGVPVSVAVGDPFGVGVPFSWLALAPVSIDTHMELIAGDPGVCPTAVVQAASKRMAITKSEKNSLGEGLMRINCHLQYLIKIFGEKWAAIQV